VTDARKEKIDENDAWDLLKKAKIIIAAKGKKVQEFNPKTDDKAVILKNAMGPSGNLRAPAFRIKQKYIIGFNEELYKDRKRFL